MRDIGLVVVHLKSQKTGGRHGNPNVLTKDVGTSSLAQGPTSHTTLVEMKKANQDIIKDVEIFKIPKINSNKISNN